MARLRAFWSNDGGSTVIEYALIGGSISIVILVGVTGIGTKVAGYFGKVSNGLN